MVCIEEKKDVLQNNIDSSIRGREAEIRYMNMLKVCPLK